MGASEWIISIISLTRKGQKERERRRRRKGNDSACMKAFIGGEGEGRKKPGMIEGEGKWRKQRRFVFVRRKEVIGRWLV